MNKKKTFKKVTSIVGLGVIGTTIGIAATSCGGSEPTPTPVYDYVGNEWGTDWKGYDKNIPNNGEIVTEIIKTPDGEDTDTCRITSYGYGNPPYAANDLVIPKYVKIGDKEYDVVEIAPGTFNEFEPSNAVLKDTLTLPEGIIKIGEAAFYNCVNLNGNIIIPNSVISIGEWAFNNCGFTGSLSIGENVETIGMWAFADCVNLNGNIIIPNSVISIGDWAFYNCNFSGVEIKKGNEVYGFADNVGQAKVVVQKEGGSFKLNEDASNVAGSLAFGKLDINTGTSISQLAFLGSCITKLNIGDLVETIEHGAFGECAKLTGNLIIPSSVDTINELAFWGCEQLINLTIWNPTIIIGEAAFQNCKLINTITFYGVSNTEKPTLGEVIFEGLSERGTIILEDSSIDDENVKDFLNDLKNAGLPDGWTVETHNI